MVSGLVLVGIGTVGIFVPGLPATVFMIMALFCFRRSSDRLSQWLLQHRRFGKTLSKWEQDKTIEPKTAMIAITMMWAFIALSAFLIGEIWVIAVVLSLGLFGTWYIASRRSRPTVPNE